MTPAPPRCAHHRDRPRAATCARCGDFLCVECARPGAKGPTCGGCDTTHPAELRWRHRTPEVVVRAVGFYYLYGAWAVGLVGGFLGVLHVVSPGGIDGISMTVAIACLLGACGAAVSVARGLTG